MSAKKSVAILVHEGYQDLQFWYPLLRLREEGTPATVIGVEPNKTYFSQLEYPVIPDVGIGEVQAQDFAAVLVPGGRSAKLIAEEPRMLGFIKEAAAAGALLAPLAEGMAAIRAAGAKDQRMVSARSTNELPAFCKALFEALGR
jgi:protease I